MTNPRILAALCSVVLLCGASAGLAQQPSYVLFEGGPVRPLALAPTSGAQLFVANAPENRLEIYDIDAQGLLAPAGSVPVGLEPVAVAARSDSEVWVVNHLSDSVSVVDVGSSPPRVLRTLLVGDEPRDIVFAAGRAFISTAHRGQHRTHSSISGVTGAGDPQLTTEGIGRADVWVFDASDPGSALGGEPDQILEFFADSPRALATDGTTVYVAAFFSGNRTTALLETSVPDVFVDECVGGPSQTPGGEGQGVPGPGTSVDPDGGGPLPEPPAPDTGLIVKFDGTNWVDALGCTWNDEVELELPDEDVFAFDAGTLLPTATFTQVGTVLFNMAINPVSDKLYVTNLESRNEVRFEGPGDHGGTTVQGRLGESRISVLTVPPDPVAVDPQHLNQHIDYTMLHTDAGADHAAIDAQIEHSLATPLQVVVSNEVGDQKVYVAALGSAKVGVFDASEIEDPSFETNFEPDGAGGSEDYLATGPGPAGLALNSTNDRLYVYTRWDNSLQVFKVGGHFDAELQTLKMPSAEPASVVDGRPVLYDAVATSGNGEASCSSCHIFGDFDGLGWNLGNPDDFVTENPQPQFGGGAGPDFHPMKGPMTTQTLRGLSTHGAMHWRGDRANGFFSPDPPECVESSGAACDEQESFENFIVAFEGLIGHDGLIAETEMSKFRAFALQLMLPPNPVAELDNSQTADQAAGQSLYFTHPSDAGVIPCNNCHVLDPLAGFFGTNGDQSEEGEPQRFKIAHLRNMVQKVGMFGVDGVPGSLATGDQVRGFGFLHDGAVDTLFNFLETGPFSLTPTQSAQIEQFMLAFPTDLAPAVGQQATIGPSSPGSCEAASVACDNVVADCNLTTQTWEDVTCRLDLLVDSDSDAFESLVLGGATTECDLVATTVEDGIARSYELVGGSFVPDKSGESALGEAALRAKAHALEPGGAQDVHYLCVPPGSGLRVGNDRDEDGVLNRDDNCPAWPNGAALGTCTAGDADKLAAKCNSAGECGSGGVCSQAQEDADSDTIGDACELSLLPEADAGPALLLGAALLTTLAARRSGRKPRARSEREPAA